MVLLLDQGNTRLKWMLVREDGTVHASGAKVNRGSLSGVCKEIRRSASGIPSEVIACNVAGLRRQADLSKAFTAEFATSVRFVAHENLPCSPLKAGYLQPQTLGLDRWLAMVGAWSLYPQALIVVSAGTAVTVDAIDRSGQHLGGYIVPGLELQLRCLSSIGTLPRLGRQHVGCVAEEVFGRTTKDAIARGVVKALASLVDACAAEQAMDGRRASVVLTGGDAAMIAGHIRSKNVVVDELVFRGLWIAATNSGAQLRL